VLIEAGVVLTIGYLITEAASVWISLSDGRVVPGHVSGYDQETGFGLVQALARVDQPALRLGRSGSAPIGERVVVAGAGGRRHSVAARIVGKQEFAGYWEYVLDEAIFTAPSHPNWGGTAVIGPAGELLGIGSLQLEQGRAGERGDLLNMVVPIDLLTPILGELLTVGRPNRAPRPWLGFYAIEVENRVVIAGLAGRGPAERADLRSGDVVLAAAGTEFQGGLAGLFRKIWSLGSAGVDVPLTIYRDGRTFDVRVRSGDRNQFLKSPSLH
ncbi:MAG: serine protease, partial [Methylobacteriaceae bacterium]|nr:serine protease [Methylobacteriaceae bacterium]